MPDYRRPKHEVAASDTSRDTTCPFCEAPAKTEIVDDTFQHGTVEISVTLPVRNCVDCDEQFLDHVGERIRTEAIYRHHGLLTPWEIRAGRDRRNLSRAAFAKITGLGEATIKRWETGATPQNRANDRYLRLLDTALGWALLQRIATSRNEPIHHAPRPPAGDDRFPNLPDDPNLDAKKDAFSLRSAA